LYPHRPAVLYLERHPCLRTDVLQVVLCLADSAPVRVAPGVLFLTPISLSEVVG
jgi:hypothetical protein